MSRLSHVNAQGEAHMVDVSGKAETVREAVAGGRISMSAEARAQLSDGSAAKGDVLAAARIAGIMAAKQTSALIPLCHPLPIHKVGVTFDLTDDGVAVRTTVRTSGKTGVEMEALTAVSIALLTIYDMLKAVDKAMVISQVQLLSKIGGKSGTYTAAGFAADQG